MRCMKFIKQRSKGSKCSSSMYSSMTRKPLPSRLWSQPARIWSNQAYPARSGDLKNSKTNSASFWISKSLRDRLINQRTSLQEAISLELELNMFHLPILVTWEAITTIGCLTQRVTLQLRKMKKARSAGIILIIIISK